MHHLSFAPAVNLLRLLSCALFEFVAVQTMRLWLESAHTRPTTPAGQRRSEVWWLAGGATCKRWQAGSPECSQQRVFRRALVSRCAAHSHAGIMTQVAADPYLGAVLSELVETSAGHEIYLRRPDHFSLQPDTPVTFEQARMQHPSDLNSTWWNQSTPQS